MNKFSFFLTFMLIFFSCEKEKIDLSVQQYVIQLERGQYASIFPPNFEPAQIPGLLAYRYSRKKITNFPVNPLSSLSHPECYLGIYVLWTIESIRYSEIKGDSEEFDRYPSFCPVIRSKTSPCLFATDTETIQSIVAEAYYTWWEQNKNKNFNDFKNINPLEKTDYRW